MDDLKKRWGQKLSVCTSKSKVHFGLAPIVAKDENGKVIPKFNITGLENLLFYNWEVQYQKSAIFIRHNTEEFMKMR